MAVERKRVRVQKSGKTASSAGDGRRADPKANIQASEIAHEAPRTPQEVALFEALDEIGAALREQGLTLEDMIESGREIRAQLIEEMYGLKSDADDT
ncbi:MAG TPA: hypothetical protein VH482_32745 [Thermomicrobiales bacterium]|jgi:hypothetical protein